MMMIENPILWLRWWLFPNGIMRRVAWEMYRTITQRRVWATPWGFARFKGLEDVQDLTPQESIFVLKMVLGKEAYEEITLELLEEAGRVVAEYESKKGAE